MNLDIAAAAVVLFALLAYVTLDGFDLGVGALLLARADEAERDLMVAAIAPTWDGNETWLILAGVGLLACFPIAYGIVLPALYLPALLMLMALGARGVSFEFRFQTVAWRSFWDRAFAGGSIVAALCQGAMLGTLLEGVSIEGKTFAGSVLDVLSPFAAITAFAVLTSYCCLGSAWLVLKTSGALARFAAVSLRAGIGLFGFAATAAFAGAVIVQPAIGAVWASEGWLLVALGTAFYGALAMSFRSAGGARPLSPFLWVLGANACVAGGLVVCVLPNVVPFRMSIDRAASPADSKTFFLIGAAAVIPIILAYTAYGYLIFRGKARLPEI